MLEDAWREHEKGAERAVMITCQDGNPNLLAFDFEKTEFVCYSWFRDEQYTGPDDIPYLRSMRKRPLEANWACHRNAADPVPPPNSG